MKKQPDRAVVYQGCVFLAQAEKRFIMKKKGRERIMPVPIKQIAELANVSRGTVDKVLNDRPGVKSETRDKILQIAKELNYQPNFLGKALVQSRNPVRIGIVLTPEYNPFIHDMLAGIRNAENEFSPFGIDVSVKMPFSLEPTEQVSILNELELEGVSGIALFPLNDTMTKNKINQLVENNIAILTCNSRIEGTNEFCFVGQNHYKGGRTAAGLLMKLLPSGGDIGMIISSSSLSCHQDRSSGFKDKISESQFPIRILDIQENQDRKDDAFKITLEYCNHHPDIKGIYVTGGGIEGVGHALELLNLNTKVKVICHDLTPDSITLLNSGCVDFVIGQNPEQQGYQLVKTLFEYLVKKNIPTDNVEIPITIITQDSL